MPATSLQVAAIFSHWAVSCEKARVELGYEAGDVETTLAHTVDWLRAEEERA